MDTERRIAAGRNGALLANVPQHEDYVNCGKEVIRELENDFLLQSSSILDRLYEPVLSWLETRTKKAEKMEKQRLEWWRRLTENERYEEKKRVVEMYESDSAGILKKMFKKKIEEIKKIRLQKKQQEMEEYQREVAERAAKQEEQRRRLQQWVAEQRKEALAGVEQKSLTFLHPLD